MKWIYQKTGIINQYNPKNHLGTQPIRVLNNMIVYMFQQTNSGFMEDILQLIQENKLERKLGLELREEPLKKDRGFHTPRIEVGTKVIQIHETFLSYLWCCTYSVFVRYCETISYPQANEYVGYNKYPISRENIDQAVAVFDYAKSLIPFFTPWDKDLLPNPEIYLAEKRDYVEQTNIYYTEAIKFILCHELTHLKYHAEKLHEATADSHFLAFEVEADNHAIDLMKQGKMSGNRDLAFARNMAIDNGIVFGLLAMFFFSPQTTAKKHPHSEDRLTNALERLELDETADAWGIACVGLKMWDEQFGLDFKWPYQWDNCKELYYNIVAQIKERA